jgi:hypothetical protein
VVADTLSHPPSLAVALPATAWQEGKPEFLPGSPAAQLAVCAVPHFRTCWTLAAIAEHQRSCQATLQASKSSSLQLRAVEVMGASLLCDFSTGRRCSTPSTTWHMQGPELHAASSPPGPFGGG